MSLLNDKSVLVTGGTGSLGRRLVRRLLSDELGRPRRVVVFSRDEAKQHDMRLRYRDRDAATDEVIYCDAGERLAFEIGDVRDYASVRSAVARADIVFHAAALKQVPNCEYFAQEAIKTNVGGAQNLARAVEESGAAVECVIGVSTDKACKPVNVMGMTKALQERVFVAANLRCADTRFAAVRYGNVIGSRGSVLPLFLSQVRQGGPVTITSPEMTRFFLSLDEAVDAVLATAAHAAGGEIFVPRIRSARILDVAAAVIGERDIDIQHIGIRPGEKTHEILVSEDECHRTVARDDYLVIRPTIPELRRSSSEGDVLHTEYSSADDPIGVAAIRQLLRAELGAGHGVAP